MTETTAQDTTSDIEPHFSYWFHGEKTATLCEAGDIETVIIELADLTANAPEDLPGWRIKNLDTGEIQTGTDLLA